MSSFMDTKIEVVREFQKNNTNWFKIHNEGSYCKCKKKLSTLYTLGDKSFYVSHLPHSRIVCGIWAYCPKCNNHEAHEEILVMCPDCEKKRIGFLSKKITTIIGEINNDPNPQIGLGYFITLTEGLPDNPTITLRHQGIREQWLSVTQTIKYA